MIEIYNLGISEDTIKMMLDVNPYIKDLSKEEVVSKIALLEYIGCSGKETINIIGSNSLYLNRSDDRVLELINYLKQVGFTSLNILFDANPYILNLEVYEIENYLNKRKLLGEKLEDIVDEMESNPYLFSDI